MKIDREIMAVLGAAVVDGNKLTLTGQLDRKTYEATNKVLLAIGGKWNRSAKAHVFEEDAAEMVDQVLLTGEYARTKQDFGQFDTPDILAEQVVNLADVRPGMSVLEPSAGIGNIAKVARQFGGFVTCWEIDAKRAEKLEGIAHSLNVGDFLAASPIPAFDRVVMNPPFAKQADIDHVMHARGFLNPGGRLASIMSASVMFRENAKAASFRDAVFHAGGTIKTLPEGSFKHSGTSVNTCLVYIPAA
jgi:predicted RNA methylase